MRGTGLLLSGPDGLCRLGNQRERLAGGRQREEGRGKERRVVTDAATGNLIKFSGRFNGHVCLSCVSSPPVFSFNNFGFPDDPIHYFMLS